MPGARDQVRLLGLCTLGGVLGFAAERVHRHAGVWVFERAGDVGWWIIPVYGLGLYAAGNAYGWLERRLDHPIEASRRTTAIEAGLLLALFLLPPLLHRHELPLLALAVLYLAGRLGWFRRRGDGAVVLFTVTVDLAVEGALVQLGLYRYANAAHAPLPLWLAPLWGGLGLSLRRLFATARPPTERVHRGAAGDDGEDGFVNG